jgi:hypothetical protein
MQPKTERLILAVFLLLLAGCSAMQVEASATYRRGDSEVTATVRR